MIFNGKPDFQTPLPRCRRASRIAAINACRKDPGSGFSTLPSDLASGRWIQFGGSSQFGRFALYKSPPLGQTISTGRTATPSGIATLGTATSLPRCRRVSYYRDCNFPPPRSGAGFYHLVSCQVGRIYSISKKVGDLEPRDHSADPASSWFAVPHRADLVPEHRSEFRSKKNEIIRLYREPPADGPVVCFDELGPLQTIPRGGKSWGNSAALRSCRYSRKNGALQFFAAFCPHSGLAAGRSTPRKTSEECRDFLKDVVLPSWPHGRIHLILDNLSSHKASPVRKWAEDNQTRIKFHWLPTNSSWLNLIESYFSTLQRVALHNTDYRTPEEIEASLLRGITYLNHRPKPYIWKKI